MKIIIALLPLILVLIALVYSLAPGVFREIYWLLHFKMHPKEKENTCAVGFMCDLLDNLTDNEWATIKTLSDDEMNEMCTLSGYDEVSAYLKAKMA